MPIVAQLIPSYKGEAEILIVSQALKDTTLSDPDLPSIITSTQVLSRVIDRLKLNTDPVALSKKVKTKLPVKSSILELTYKDSDAARAATITNAIAAPAPKTSPESSAWARPVPSRRKKWRRNPAVWPAYATVCATAS